MMTAKDQGDNVAHSSQNVHNRGRNRRNTKSSGGQHHHHRKNHKAKNNRHSNNDNNNNNNNNGNNMPQLRSRKQISHAELTSSLMEVSTSRQLIESTDGIQNRRQVMQRLNSMLGAWSESLTPTASYADMLTSRKPKETNHPYLLSFGSYRLGVHTPDADVDCLVLAPPHIQRHDFFDSWITVLKNAEVDDLHPVATAYTPVVKFSMNGIKIDMVFARITSLQMNWLADCKLRLEQAKMKEQVQMKENSIDSESEQAPSTEIVIEHNAHDLDDGLGEIADKIAEMVVSDDMLIGLDETSVRCVNGVRVSQYLLATVGTNPTRLENFRLTLRIVKEWARVHGLYSNVLGFLGGVNWAILVCWVCKENPNAKASMLLNLFFRTFANWTWPHPVLLAKQQHLPIKGVTSHPIWDPVSNFRDSKHLMPIITPCYPSMNSSYNVGEPQLRRIQDELRRATKISHDVCFGRKTWSDLFKGNDFFRQHANYLQVDIIGTQEDDFREWFGLCEARMRILIAGLENPSFGTQAYPFAKFFTRKEEDGKYMSSFFVALRFAEDIEKVDLRPLTMDYLQIVNSWEGRKESMDLAMNIVSQKNLPPFAFEVESAEKENELDDGSTSSETSTKTNEEGESSLNVVTTNADSREVTKTMPKSPPRSAKKKLELENDSGTPSMFISPLKRAKIG